MGIMLPIDALTFEIKIIFFFAFLNCEASNINLAIPALIINRLVKFNDRNIPK
jgi:hypothetical protein